MIPNQGSTTNANFASHNTFQQYSVSLPQFQLIRNNLSSSYTYIWRFGSGSLFDPARINTAYQILKTSNGINNTCAYEVQSSDYTPTSNKTDMEEVFQAVEIQDSIETVWYSNLKSKNSIDETIDDMATYAVVSDCLLYTSRCV